eukprot:CAMPEP_0202483340 /NCGR_PEP_ID=MMETSP1361-20130828/2595_1 /ASSEMBLY_ACC=CAM_ASM_000849 /TAXON_ID=210615 /ORGANISM="Staurosira complex sp., Strain CCMP2646" /LENGTH=83 /DNA_ID=CAMNT_0049111545 /DNA_START=92 /DNA_END=343 /DNA_ORIENTATION=+
MMQSTLTSSKPFGGSNVVHKPSLVSQAEASTVNKKLCVESKPSLSFRKLWVCDHCGCTSKGLVLKKGECTHEERSLHYISVEA